MLQPITGFWSTGERACQRNSQPLNIPRMVQTSITAHAVSATNIILHGGICSRSCTSCDVPGECCGYISSECVRTHDWNDKGGVAGGL